MSGPSDNRVSIVSGEAAAGYGFGHGHPFGPDRHDAFLRGLRERQLESRVLFDDPRTATRQEVEWFHAPHHVGFVEEMSLIGEGYLDFGDTPAFPGIYEASRAVVGATLRAGEMVMAGAARRAFVPIAGLHHAARNRTSGFCVFNDCAVLIEALRRRHGLRRIAYVDIDAHHGDGVYYGFAEDPDVCSPTSMRTGVFCSPAPAPAARPGTGPRWVPSSICRWRRVPTTRISAMPGGRSKPISTSRSRSSSSSSAVQTVSPATR